jgi:hypothetical protein
MTITAPSSSDIPFPPAVPQKFEPWREAWIRPILADPKLGYVAKLVACFLLWYLNRQTRDCFPSYQTIADGIGVNRRTAMRGVTELKTRGYLRRQSRGKGQSNLYSPTGQVVSRQTLGSVTPDTSTSVTPDTLTFEIEPLNEPCSRSALCESADGTQKILKNGAGRTSSPRYTGTPQKNGARYAWEGRVGRLTAPDLERWRKAYSEVAPDITAVLQHADDYYADHPPNDGRWFHRFSRWLEKENHRRLEQRRAAEEQEWSL